MTATEHDNPRGGRAVAWVGFVFGSVMSTAANVLYTWIPHPPEGAPPGWAPPEGWAPSAAAQIGAAVWPLALLLSVEILSRVRWAPGWQWALARYGGAGVVAVGSAAISYGHLYGVLQAWSYGVIGCVMGPLVLDGLMVVSGFALLAPPGEVTAVAESAAEQAVDEPAAESPKVEPSPRNAAPVKPRPGRVRPPSAPAGLPTLAKPRSTAAAKTPTQQRDDEARKALHAAGDHSLCKARTCRVVRASAADTEEMAA